MQKKAVQLSSTTLNLRFMQNAKIRQEQRETEVAQVKVQNEERWHLSFATEEWPEPSYDRTDSTIQNIVHESSYLPFLFKSAAKSNVPDGIEGETSMQTLKGRRAFGKHGREEDIAASTPTQPEHEEQSTEEVGDHTNSIPVQPISFSKPLPYLSDDFDFDKVSSSRKIKSNAFLSVEKLKTTKRPRVFENFESARKKKKPKAA